MSRHTFPLASRRRLVICPDKFQAGSVRIEIQSADKNIMGSVTLDGPTLALVCHALELEAQAALALDCECGTVAAIDCQSGIADADTPWFCERGNVKYPAPAKPDSVEVQLARLSIETMRRAAKAVHEDAMLARHGAARQAPGVVQAWADNNGVAPSVAGAC